MLTDQPGLKKHSHRQTANTKHTGPIKVCLQRIFREERGNSSISWGIHLADNVNHYLHAPKEYMFRLCYLFNYIFHDHVQLFSEPSSSSHQQHLN